MFGSVPAVRSSNFIQFAISIQWIYWDLHLDTMNRLFILFCVLFSDEEKLFANAQPDADWEEFAIVAADLLERIQSSLSYNNSAYASSEEAFDDDDDEFLNAQAINMSKTSFKLWLANS